MKVKKILAPGLVLLAGLAGYVLRQRELSSGFDETGLNVPSQDARLLVALLGIAAGACQLANDALYYQGKPPQPYAELVPVVYLICLLIYHFRSWSIDPVVLDYCFRLFALIGTLAGVFALGGYAFDRGRRGSVCLFCALGAYFCILSLADGGTAQMLIFAACALGLACAAGAEPAEEDPA